VTAPTTALTKADMVLLALYRVANGTTQRVPYEELALQAWRDYPDAFSLRNHPEHPDASDVHKRLYGTLAAQGLVLSIGDKTFRLTDKGAERASMLLVSPQASAQSQSGGRLARDQQTFVARALRSRPFAVWQAGQSQRLVAYDARVFFQFATATPVTIRQRKVAFALEATRRAREARVPNAEELHQLAAFLATTFRVLLEEG